MSSHFFSWVHRLCLGNLDFAQFVSGGLISKRLRAECLGVVPPPEPLIGKVFLLFVYSSYRGTRVAQNETQSAKITRLPDYQIRYEWDIYNNRDYISALQVTLLVIIHEPSPTRLVYIPNSVKHSLLGRIEKV
jgi:hypothetical protein